MVSQAFFCVFRPGILALCLCVVVVGGGAPVGAAAKREASDKVVVTPQQPANGSKTVVNGVEQESPAPDPATTAMEERVMRYKFILESLGFTLEEIVFSPDWAYKVELIFKGRLNAPLEKLEELAEKFKDEPKLMDMLRTVYDYNNRDLTNYGASMVVLRLAEPVEIQVHYRKF